MSWKYQVVGKLCSKLELVNPAANSITEDVRNIIVEDKTLPVLITVLTG